MRIQVNKLSAKLLKIAEMTATLHVSPIQKLKDRVKRIKPKLSKKGYQACLEIIFKHYPQYNTHEGWQLLKSVWDVRKADDILTGILEEIANNKLK